MRFIHVIAILALGMGLPLIAADPLPVDLSPVANRALADPIAGDGVGGWIDQGPERDLSAFATGIFHFGTVPLRLDPGPHACIALGPPNRQVPATVRVRLPDKAGRNLYLLHALAWSKDVTKVGSIAALDDGGRILGTIEVVAGKDVADWWGVTDLPNGRVALRTRIEAAEVGLFLSRFTLPEGARTLRLEAVSTAMWGIVAMTLADQEQTLPPPPVTGPAAVAGSGWEPIVARKEVIAGSAADLSFLLDAPAGRHGFAVPGPDGRLRFEDGTRARFAGSNLCLISGDILTSHSEEHICALAERWARMGNNIMRVFYSDRGLIEDTTAGLRLLDAPMARFDLLAAELKKRGVYLAVDLLWSRIPHHAVSVHCPEFYAAHRDKADDIQEFYIGALNFLPALRDDWEEAARLLLGHINPRTGRALKDDPQLVAIGLANEDNLDNFYRKGPELRELARRAFLTHLEARYHNDAGLAKAWGPLRAGESLEHGTVALPGWAGSSPREADLFDCLVTAQTGAWRDLASRLRRLGCRQVLSASNYISSPFTAAVRRPHDAVDNHAYWDHPRFPESGWSLPYSFEGCSLLSVPSGWRRNPAAELATSRHWGKPMLVTEYDHVFPNQGRCDAGLISGAMAALQGWDLFTSFNYSFRPDDLFDPTPIRNFDKVNDPLAMAIERQMRLVFLRGDVREAIGRVALRADPARLSQASVGEEASLLACVTGVGLDFTRNAGATLPVTPDMGGSPLIPRLQAGRSGLEAWLSSLKGVVLPVDNRSDGAAQRLVSDTGELTWDYGSGKLLMETPRTQGAVVTTPGRVVLSGLAADIDAAPATISVSSLDGKPLTQCTRALAVFATDVVNSGMIVDEGRRRLHAFGTLPLLVRSASATVVLNAVHLRRAWALDTGGARLAEIPIQREGDRLTVRLSTVRGGQGTLMAELSE